MGYAPNIEDYSDTPIDLLHVGTHNPKYVPQKQQWVELAGLPPTASCRRSVEGKGETKEAKVVLVLNPDQSDDPINHYKESLQISAEDLEAVADDPRIDDAFLASKLPNAESQIHYFRYLGVTPERFEAMKQMTRISSIWYLEFTLDWKSKSSSEELYRPMEAGSGRSRSRSCSRFSHLLSLVANFFKHLSPTFAHLYYRWP